MVLRVKFSGTVSAAVLRHKLDRNPEGQEISCRAILRNGPAAPTPIQNISGLPQGLAGRFVAGWTCGKLTLTSHH